ENEADDRAGTPRRGPGTARALPPRHPPPAGDRLSPSRRRDSGADVGPRPRTCYRHRHLALRQTAAHVVPAPDGGGMASERRGRPAGGRGLARPRPKSLTRRPKSAKIGGLIDTAMLVLEISQIPPEGLELDEPLDPAS